MVFINQFEGMFVGCVPIMKKYKKGMNAKNKLAKAIKTIFFFLIRLDIGS